MQLHVDASEIQELKSLPYPNSSEGKSWAKRQRM
jgi:hypothetical protein